MDLESLPTKRRWKSTGFTLKVFWEGPKQLST